jgi:ribosomal protein L11 methyltransferase
MDYYELHFSLTAAEDYQKDLLIDSLGAIGFDTFEEVEDGFKAYIPAGDFSPELVDEQLAGYRLMFGFVYETKLIRQKNWNEVWESNFEPITVAGKVYVRATFHQPRPDFPYEIVIDPKMAFGTGHHQTTSMMMALMLETSFAGKNVLDMGCGTGILAILAEKLGAAKIMAIDYDPVCYESTLENAALNQAQNINAACGSKEAMPQGQQFDIILANINRNILLDQLAEYAAALKPGGELYLSGFYETPDLAILTREAAASALKYISHKKEKDWVAAKFEA